MPENSIRKKEKALLETRAALKKALKELKACEVDTHRLIEKSVHGALVVDGERTIQHANKAAAALFDTSATDLVGQKCSLPFTKNRATESSLMLHNRMLTLEIWALTVRWAQRPATLIYIVDITERKRVEEKLRRLAAIVESSHDAILGWTLDGIVTSWNQGAGLMFGYSPEEILGQSVSVLSSANHFDEMTQILHNMGKEEGVALFETECITKSGRRLQVSLSMAPVIDTGGKVVGASMIARDITERKLAEKKLRESEQQLAEAQEIAHLGSYEWDLLSNDLVMSSELCRIFDIISDHFSYEDFLGRIHSDDREEFAKVIRKAIAEKNPFTCYYRIIRHNGMVRSLHSQGRVVTDNSGRAVAIVASCLDVTELKRAEEAQQQQLSFLQKLIDTIPAPIFYKDADGKYLGCNASFEKFVGRSKSEIIGRTVYELAPPDLAEIYHKMDEELFNSAGIQVYETSVVDSHGKHKEVIFNKATFTDRSGKVAGLVGVIIDITDRKEVERLKDEMISTVSHEMRTPLTAILGYIEFMLENEVDPGKQREYLVTVHSATQRLNELVDNFLTMQRLRAKLGNYDFKPLDIGALLAEVAALFDHASPRHKVTVMRPPDVPPVLGDWESLNRVLNNLVSNAIKYSPKGGEIVMGAERDNDTVKIWTKDEGIGIAPEFQKKIFDRFYRVDNTSRRATGGTGLGLALVREIVEAHGGRIWVESVPGTGSTFYLSLPIAKNQSVPQ